MSKENVAGFFDSLSADIESGLSIDPAPAEVIGLAQQKGFEFSESELQCVINEMIFAALSLPRNWGWKLARRLDLVRKT